LNALARFIRASLQAESKPRVIIQDRQRMAAVPIHGEVAFEVHLPQPIGSFVLEPLPGAMRTRLRRIDQTAAPQNCVYGAGRRNAANAQRQQPMPDLASSPGGMLLTQLDDRPFHLIAQSTRTSKRTTREIL
jgi:hypothetical protein